ncbi:hypothetical protein K469DRAFT_713644 [Zopfia rhizophila CBS 207.26]|uniref:Uncharacterized protein n=1 Tax=Zopfia rhizophila CBS 207.26 TaxID=1314779 RepID=A0A6A6DTN6_9PEZI|nr:hypothetical protein K469DRAFT_713644 [Zopfia rhizophila CBS 207.26]
MQYHDWADDTKKVPKEDYAAFLARKQVLLKDAVLRRLVINAPRVGAPPVMLF